MKIFFTRHGEAMDDLENRYGGWYDPGLSPAGKEGAVSVGKKMNEMGFSAELILSSPLKRATQTAKGIKSVLDLPIEVCVYLKERNTYGLLCGEEKNQAKQKYPELVEAYEKGEEVLGYEDYDFFLKRVKILIEYLKKRKENVLICVTHGKLLGALFKDILKVKVKKFHDNCIAEINIDEVQNLTLGRTEGIDLE